MAASTRPAWSSTGSPPTSPGADGRKGFSGQFTTSKAGAQKVYVYAKNVPGTSGSDRLIGIVDVTIYVDTTAPKTTITSAPRYATTRDVIRVTFTADEQNVTFECRWDDQPGSPARAAPQVSLTPGNHMISVRAHRPVRQQGR